MNYYSQGILCTQTFFIFQYKNVNPIKAWHELSTFRGGFNLDEWKYPEKVIRHLNRRFCN